MDTTTLLEIGKWIVGVGIGAWTAYKAARGGAHKGGKEGVSSSTESVNQVVSEVVHEVKGPNGGNNLRSIVERIEEKTDEQTRSLLALHRSEERRNARVEHIESVARTAATTAKKLERRVVTMEDHVRKMAHTVETKLGGATEVVIKKEDQ